MVQAYSHKRQSIAGITSGIAGIIPGKVNPKVADDVTINAKKGEYVFPDYVVKAIGADKLDQMVMSVQKQLGMPIGIGPKQHNQPDNIGRVDTRGLKGIAGFADAGEVDNGIYGRETVFSKPIDDISQAVSSAASGAVNAIPSITAALSDAYDKTLGNNGSAGSGAPTYAPDPYSLTSALPSTPPPAPAAQASISSISSLPEAYRPPMDFTTATTQAKRGITDLNNIPVTAAAPLPAVDKPTHGTGGIAGFSNDLVLRSQVQPENIDNLISKVNEKYPMPTPLSEYDRAFVGKRDDSNPSYRNSMAVQGVYDDKVKAATTNRQVAQSIITGIIPTDIATQGGIAGNNIKLQGTLATEAVNAQRNADQNTQEAEKNRQSGITGIALSKLYGAQANLANEQAKNVPDKNLITTEAANARHQDIITKGMTDFAKTGATEEQVRDHGSMLKAQLEGDQFIPSTPATPEHNNFFSPNTPAQPAVPAQIIEKPPVNGAKKSSRDGKWYVTDPKRPGKFLRVGV